MGLALFIALASLAVFLLVMAMGSEQRVSRQWSFGLDGPAMDQYRSLSDQVAYEQHLSARHYSQQQTQKYLGAGLAYVEATSSNLTETLRGLSRVSRMAEAVAPVEPYPIRVWSYPPNKRLAVFGRIVRVFLISTGDRLRLRLWLVRRGLWLSVRLLRRGTRREDLVRIGEGRKELRTAQDEALVSAKAVFESLCATRKS